MRIVQLPSAVANQIAAGEVIERPASVVKELLENALDAAANEISIDIHYGGLNQIKISDNGLGIMAQDLPLAVAPHATSKIRTLDDLYAIQSMGFRGEALASIASVSKFCLSSKTAHQAHGMSLRLRGKTVELIPCARNNGTTVEVCDLFFNAPVRKRFLKGAKLEFQAIETVVKRFALSAPSIAISLKHNGKIIFSLPAACTIDAEKKRMSKLMGSQFAKNAIFLDVEHANMRLHGWISDRNFQRSHNDKLWVYINQRMVKDKLIHHALKQVYEGLLHPGRFPACLLYFSIPNAEVDVNVHPSKAEVRFVQPKLIHDFFTSQLSAALKALSQDEGLSLCMTEELNAATWTFPAQSLRLEKRELELKQTHAFNQWFPLNSRYLVLSLQEQVYLVDVQLFMQEKIRKQLSQMTLPLLARPLLVPIAFELGEQLQTKIVPMLADLNQLGLQIQGIEEGRLLIGSIPHCTPYLDLRLFFDALKETPFCDMEILLDLLSHSQKLDSRQLSLEDQRELHHSLSNQEIQIWAKALTEEVCRNCLYA